MADRVASFLLPFAQRFIKKTVGKAVTFAEHQAQHAWHNAVSGISPRQRLSRLMAHVRKPRVPMRTPMTHVFNQSDRFSRSQSTLLHRRFVRQRRRGASILGARRQRRTNTMRIPTELKFLDTSLTNNAISQSTDATGGENNPTTTVMMTTPAVGDGEEDRDGKHIIIKSIHIMGSIHSPLQANLTVPSEPSTGMVALVHDTNTQGLEINSEDVFKNIGAEGTHNSLLHRNLLFGKRFKVLRLFRWYMPLGAGNVHDGTNIEQFGQKRRFEWWIPRLNMIVNFNAGTTNVIANVIDNSLQIIAFNSVNSGQPTAQVSYTARIRFVG